MRLFHASPHAFAMRNPTGGLVDPPGKAPKTSGTPAASEQQPSSSSSSSSSSSGSKSQQQPSSSLPRGEPYIPSSAADRLLDRLLDATMLLYPSTLRTIVARARRDNSAAYKRFRFAALNVGFSLLLLLGSLSVLTYGRYKMQQVDSLQFAAANAKRVQQQQDAAATNASDAQVRRELERMDRGGGGIDHRSGSSSQAGARREVTMQL
jgi:hypothetical protein